MSIESRVYKQTQHTGYLWIPLTQTERQRDRETDKYIYIYIHDGSVLTRKIHSVIAVSQPLELYYTIIRVIKIIKIIRVGAVLRS